jgi:hypothetical protein
MDSATEPLFPKFNYTGAQMAQVERQPRNVSPHPLFPLAHPDEVGSDILSTRVLTYGRYHLDPPGGHPAGTSF